MKKFVVLLVVLLLPITAYASGELYQLVKSEKVVTINGQAYNELVLDYNGKTYVPIDVFKNAGGEIKENTNSIDIEIYNEKQILENIKKNQDSSVMIKGYYEGTSNPCTGSGQFIAPNYVITNYHVVRGCKALRVKTFKETCIVDKIEYYDELLDVAILHVPFNAEPVKLGDSFKLSCGETVFTISSQRGYHNMITKGIISEFRNVIVDFKYFTPPEQRRIQTDASIDAGSSGGGLYNAKGELVGIIQSKLLNCEGVNFCIPINEVKHIIEKYQNK